MISCMILLLNLASLPQQAAPPADTTQAVQVRSFEDGALASYRRDPAYEYDRPPSVWAQWGEGVMAWLSENVVEVPEGVRTGKALEWLVYLLAIAGVVYAVVRLLQIDVRGITQRAGPSAPQELEMAAAGADTEVDFERLLDEAVRERRYRRAVRLQYLHTLGELDRRGLVRRRREKTNYDYLRELPQGGDNDLREPFRRLTSFFEHVWYGSRPVAQQQYDRIASAFRDFRQRL
jgi:hypothetical protein